MASHPESSWRAESFDRVRQAMQAGDLEAASRLAVDALAKGFEHPLFLNLRALDHETHGRLEASLADLRRAHLLAPRDFGILNACGLCLARLGRLDDALACYKQALDIEPAFGPALFNSGWVLEQLGETARAADAYEKTAELNPKNAQAWANAAWLAARRGDTAAARRFADQALAVQPGHATAILALANAELDQPLVAERRLRDLLTDPNLSAYDRGVALSQLGDVLDALGRPAEAFVAYQTGNFVFRADAAPRFEAPGQPTVQDTLGWLVPWSERLDGPSWRSRQSEPRSGAGERGHVFLVGFPRSGTTLMETVLAAHPDVASLEERNTLQAAVRDFMGDLASIRRLANLSDRELQPYRDDYWERVAGAGGAPEGKVFIDKNPFNTLKLPVIYKLFPHAKIIFALRDPRDVVLSCFRRRFNLNPSTYELLDLGRAASLYDGTMRFAETLAAKQAMHTHRLVYERLVADFAAEARAACAFIGVDWREGLEDFAERGRRGDVASASSAQISRGLYADGAGQWRRYRDQLAPVLPILAPWVERFGYPAE